ncbi:MAG: sel1 repeat family protein [Myxococcaceae bacterium]|nr:sel1 repeat family protein [Myxococcaceae bacterium]
MRWLLVAVGVGVAALGAYLVFTDAPEHGRDDGEVVLKKKCDANAAEACAALADLWARPLFKEPRPLVATRTKACDLGLGRACEQLGHMLMEGDYGHRVNVDRVAATQAFAKGCGLEHGPSCRRWGESLEKGRGVASVDLGEATKAYQRACTLKDDEGCQSAVRLAR